MKLPRNTIAHVLAALGGCIILTELLRYWLRGHHMEGAVIGIGALFGFIGCYISDPRRALQGGTFVVDAVTQVVAAVRSGRRATDGFVVQHVDREGD